VQLTSIFRRVIMGGVVTVAIRKSDNSLHAFKHGTWFVEYNINDINSLDEDKLFAKLAHHEINSDRTDREDHENYDSYRACFAPYHYGILFFDFVNKKVFSHNDYNGFQVFGSTFIKTEYLRSGKSFLHSDYKLKFYRQKNGERELERIVDMLEENPKQFNIAFPYHFHQAIKNGAEITFKNKRIYPEDVNEFYALISDYDLKNKTEEEQKEILIQYLKEDENLITNISEWTDVSVIMPGWSVHYDNFATIYQYLLDEKVDLTAEEKLIWQAEIKDENEEDNDE
jgi:hypothetical protein